LAFLDILSSELFSLPLHKSQIPGAMTPIPINHNSRIKYVPTFRPKKLDKSIDSISDNAVTIEPNKPVEPAMRTWIGHSFFLVFHLMPFSALLSTIMSDKGKRIFIHILIEMYLAKLSECLDYRESFNSAWSYCEMNGLLQEISDISLERKEIDAWIRYKIDASPKRVFVSAYLLYLEKAVEARKQGYNKLKNEMNTKHVALCLYKMMEEDLPEKLEPTI
jgi:hypothetical protein